jgi:putative flippase GtrA
MQIAKYIGVQVGCFALDLLIFFTAYGLDIPVFYANTLSKTCSGIAAFLLQRHWVFQSTHQTITKQSLRYLSLWIANIPITSLLTAGLYHVTGNPLLSKILIDGLAFVINYLVSRRLIFNK